MQKVLRNDFNSVEGYTNTTKPRGEYAEFCDAIGYTQYLTVAETIKSADIDTFHIAFEHKGEWY